jgi:alpha-glucosidase
MTSDGPSTPEERSRSTSHPAPTTSGRGAEWWRRAVVYQIYPRSFADSNGDGVGDLPGIIERLDYLSDLGVDALWLSPIFRSPMADFGYDVSDYCDIDPTFGALDDLDALIAGLHARNMRLLLDWVPNHTSDRHPWFVESRSARDDPRRDWYVWRDRAPDGDPPNNWMAVFKGVPAWTHDEATDQSYLHLFLAEQPDLNWANPDVESAMHGTLRFWLDRGVDGFRADVVHLIGKNPDELPDVEGPPRTPMREIDTPEGHERLRRIRQVLDGYDHDPMIVGEVYLLGDGESASYLGDPDAGRGELHLSFDFRPVHSGWDAEQFADVLTRMQTEFADPRWPTWVLSNHDQSRHRTRFGSEARARAAAVLASTVRGTPFLYAGEELGLEDANVPPDRTVDPDDRDGCRAPFPWLATGTDDTGHGWTTTSTAASARPWLPFPTNASTHAAELQIGVDSSMHTLYRRLLDLRRTTPQLHSGAMSDVRRDRDLLVFDRRIEGDPTVFTTIVNFGDEDAPWPDGVDGDVVLSTHDERRSRSAIAGCEALVVRGEHAAAPSS